MTKLIPFQFLGDDELAQVLSSVSDLLESAAAMTDIAKAREHVERGLEALREKLDIPAFNGTMSDGTISLPTSSPPHKFHFSF